MAADSSTNFESGLKYVTNKLNSFTDNEKVELYKENSFTDPKLNDLVKLSPFYVRIYDEN